MYNKNGIGYQDNGSSKAAADFNTEGKLTLRQKVADLFDKHGRLTAEQVANLLNKAEISVKPRISELKKEGYIKNSGDKVIGKWGTSISVWEKV
jgi:predicted HTH transcriptional regulator